MLFFSRMQCIHSRFAWRSSFKCARPHIYLCSGCARRYRMYIGTVYAVSLNADYSLAGCSTKSWYYFHFFYSSSNQSDFSKCCIWQNGIRSTPNGGWIRDQRVECTWSRRSIWGCYVSPCTGPPFSRGETEMERKRRRQRDKAKAHNQICLKIRRSRLQTRWPNAFDHELVSRARTYLHMCFHADQPLPKITMVQ